MQDTGQVWYIYADPFLVTSHATTGASPVSLCLSQSICARLNLQRPTMHGSVRANQDGQKQCHDNQAWGYEFLVGTQVLAGIM